jgi:formylmethanofuran dehydrogenase subunit C
MSGLTFRLKTAPGERLDVRSLTPSHLANLSSYEIGSLPIGHSKHGVCVGDVFDVEGDAGDTVTIVGGDAILDYAGAELGDGTVVVEGNAGAYAGRKMAGGRLIVKGDAGNLLASGMSGGSIHVTGAAGDQLASVIAGDRFGMTGGTVVVGGDIGARAGDKMRRGTVVVKGKTGAGTGTRMIGGTIWAEGGLGPDPGYMMRRGTMIAPSVERLLPTFVDCGRHDLVMTRILSRYLSRTLGALAPAPLPLFVRKIGGDTSTIGRGEILLPA